MYQGIASSNHLAAANPAIALVSILWAFGAGSLVQTVRCHRPVRGVRPSVPLLLGVVLCAGLGVGVLVIFLPNRSSRVTVSRLSGSSDSGRVGFEVHNRTHKAIRLDSAHVLARFGTNWGFVSHITLGGTNLTTQAVQFEVQPASDKRDWKVKIDFGPQVTGAKLLWWLVKAAWQKRSISEGFRLTGWDAEQYAYSEEFHQ